ncbi:MAG: nucleotidyltransferase domain-containing protein, partial [Bacteroidota bacterium]
MEQLYKKQLEQIILFGSHAKGEATAYSDVDLLLLLDQEEVNPYQEVPKITEEVFDLALEYNQVLFYLPISTDRWKKEKSFFL